MSRNINELAEIVLAHVYQLGYQHRRDIGKHHETNEELVAVQRKLRDAKSERDRLATEVETLRQQFDNAQRELSEQGLVHGVEGWQEAADLQKQLNAAQAALTRERLNAEERDKELERLRAFVAQVRSVVESEWYGVEMPAVRELLAQLDARTIKPVPVTEPAPCPDWRAALAELDAEGGA